MNTAFVKMSENLKKKQFFYHFIHFVEILFTPRIRKWFGS